MVDNIKLIKFTDGEEIITNVVSQDDKGVTFKESMRIVIMPPSGPDAKPSIGFAGFLPYIKDDTVTVKSEHVFIIANVVDDIVEQWKLVFGKNSSIWMPPPPPANDPLAAIKAAAKDPLATTKKVSEIE